MSGHVADVDALWNDLVQTGLMTDLGVIKPDFKDVKTVADLTATLTGSYSEEEVRYAFTTLVQTYNNMPPLVREMFELDPDDSDRVFTLPENGVVNADNFAQFLMKLVLQMTTFIKHFLTFKTS